jgi:hypothetical protein
MSQNMYSSISKGDERGIGPPTSRGIRQSHVPRPLASRARRPSTPPPASHVHPPAWQFRERSRPGGTRPFRKTRAALDGPNMLSCNLSTAALDALPLLTISDAHSPNQWSFSQPLFVPSHPTGSVVCTSIPIGCIKTAFPNRPGESLNSCT